MAGLDWHSLDDMGVGVMGSKLHVSIRKGAVAGSFTTRWKLARSTVFVAQWRGDDAHRGDGTPALGVKVVRRRR